MTGLWTVVFMAVEHNNSTWTNSEVGDELSISTLIKTATSKYFE